MPDSDASTPGILGLHHITATVGHAQPDLDFHVGVLGLRLVKTTVNFDNPGVYHFYYGDAAGTPGSIMTTFPYAGEGVRAGRRGTGQATLTRYAVPGGTLDRWREWLEGRAQIRPVDDVVPGAPCLGVQDPSGLRYALVEEPWEGGGELAPPPERPDAPDPDMAIRRIHSVVLEVAELRASVDFACRHLGLAPQREAAGRVHLGPGSGGHAFLELREAPAGARAGLNGMGTVHHVAMAVENAEVQRAFQSRLRAAGAQVTEVRDRQYFTSIYLREPGGVLYEIATRGPGFTVDEEPDALGESLRLPPWMEARRAPIEETLPPITLPGTSIRIPE